LLVAAPVRDLAAVARGLAAARQRGLVAVGDQILRRDRLPVS
jgi:hypothetical protein